MHVTVIPGVGPATAERLRRAGIHTVAELERVSEDELVRLLGKAHGAGLYALARAEDDRPVVPERETKSVSVEGTYDTDLTDRKLMEGLLTRQAGNVAERLRKSGLSGRTVTIKVRLHDFTTLSRSTTLPSPTDHGADDRAAGPRRCSPTWTPPAASACSASASPAWPTGSRRTSSATTTTERRGGAGRRVADARPAPPDLGARAWTSCTTEMGRGWVWGSGRGVVTVRFETAETPPGPVRSLRRGRPGAQRVAAAGASRSE